MTAGPTRSLLVVDDDEGLRTLMVRTLAKRGWSVRGAGSGAEAVGLVPGLENPLLFLDQRLPDMEGSEVVALLKDQGHPVPFVMMTGEGNERLAVEMMKQGASDYLVKDTDLLDRIPGVLDRVLRSLDTERRLQTAEQALREKAAELESLNQGLEQKVEARTRELTAKNAELSEALAHLRDAQDRIMESDRLKTVAQLVAGVAHEINTPLGVALTAATALQDLFRDAGFAGAVDSQVEELGGLVVRNLERSADLVQKFKQLAVDQDGPGSGPFDLGEYLEYVVSSIRPVWGTRPLRLDADLAPGLVVRGPSSAYTQLVTHLVMNSLAHGFQEEDSGTMTLSIRKTGPFLVLNYTDNGRGMDEETKKHVFDPFFTTRRTKGNLGLGLTIVGNLVFNQWGGKMDLETAPGHGVRFTLTIPWASVDPSLRTV